MRHIDPSFIQTGLLLPPAIPLKISEVKGLHVKKNDPLFPHLPCAEDIAQGGLYDCALLSSLISLVKLRPDFIMKMMSEDRDGNVAVRLYQNGKEYFTKIEKSVRFSPGSIVGSSMARGPLWVNMIEKAVTVFLFAGDYSKWEQGLDLEKALNTLLGKSAEYFFTNFEVEEQAFTKLMEWPTLHSWAKINESLRKVKPENIPLLRLIEINNSNIQQVQELGLELNEAEMNAWEQICNGDQQKLKTRWIKFAKDFLRKHGALRQHDFQNFINVIYSECKAEQKKVLEKILDWSERNSIFPGKRGSGKYTKQQLKIYDLIKTRKDSSVIVTNTFESFRNTQLFFKCFGAKMHKGLVVDHAYAVINCKEEKGLLYIQVANPWGDGIIQGVGRGYHLTQEGYLKPVKIRSAVSYIELSDFTKSFLAISFSQPLNSEEKSIAVVKSEKLLQQLESSERVLFSEKSSSVFFAPKLQQDNVPDSGKTLACS